MGRVSKLLANQEFEVHWFQRKTRSNVFWALKNKDGSAFLSTASTESVMFWNMSSNSGPDCFTLSEFWLKRICHEYDSHDKCYA